MIGGDSSRYQAWTDCSSLRFDGEAMQTAQIWTIVLLYILSVEDKRDKSAY